MLKMTRRNRGQNREDERISRKAQRSKKRNRTFQKIRFRNLKKKKKSETHHQTNTMIMKTSNPQADMGNKNVTHRS